MAKPLKPKKCKDCEEIFQPFKTLQPRCVPCAIEKGKSDTAKQVKKAKKKSDKEFKKETTRRKRKLNRNTLKWQHKNTQPRFNKMRVFQELQWFRKRGIEPYCISCLKTNMDWCCGHFKTVGAHSELRYSKKNTFLQCNRYCNMALSGNIEGNKNTIGYKKGLEHRFGTTKATEIIEHCEGSHKPYQWTIEELEGIRSNANMVIRYFEKGGK